MVKKANIYDNKGEKVSTISLPIIFDEYVRPDVIGRAVLAIQANARQRYGADPMAGKKSSFNISKRRRDYKTCYGHGISRVPRKIMSGKAARFNWVGAFSPGCVGGRNAHPPKALKIWDKKINKKERRLAIRSAIAATVDKSFVTARGHRCDEVALILDDSCNDIAKTKDVEILFSKLGLSDEMERVSERTIRSGVGKLRGRKYKGKSGPLVVVSKDCPLFKSASNLSGVDVVLVNKLNAELLAPGCKPGRLTIWTKEAIEKLKEGLFA